MHPVSARPSKHYMGTSYAALLLLDAALLLQINTNMLLADHNQNFLFLFSILQFSLQFLKGVSKESYSGWGTILFLCQRQQELILKFGFSEKATKV